MNLEEISQRLKSCNMISKGFRERAVSKEDDVNLRVTFKMCAKLASENLKTSEEG